MAAAVAGPTPDYTVPAREVIECAGKIYMSGDDEADARHRRARALVYALLGIDETLQNVRINGMHVFAETVS